MAIDLSSWGKVNSPAAPPRPAVAAAPPFRPAFEQPRWHGLNDTSGPLNEEYFATAETADYLMRRYGGLTVVEEDFIASGGAFRSEPKMRLVRFLSPAGNHADVNAGWLAAYFRAMPEDEFPGLADKYVRKIIGDFCARADGQNVI